MNHVLTNVAKLRRPKVLNDAARIASRSYKRDQDLQKLLFAQDIQTEIHKDINNQNETGVILLKLIACEEEINSSRKAAPQFYDPSRHIAVLGAIIAEAAVLQDTLETKRPVPHLPQESNASSIQRQHRLHRQRIAQDQTNVSGMDAFFSTRYASSASAIAGSSAGC